MKFLQALLWVGLVFKLIQCAIKPFGSIPLKAYSSNQKEITYFLFSFLNEISISSNAFVQVIFPPEYKAYFFESNLECSMLQNVQNFLPNQLQNSSFSKLPCEFDSNGVIIIQVGSILNGINQVVVGQIRNPSLPQTSEFGIRTFYNDVMVEQNDAFSTLSLAPPPLQIKNPEVFRVSNSRISEGSSWQFDFQTVQSYNSGNTFRFTFPEGFQSKKVLCNVDNLYGNDPIVEIYHNKRTVSCKNLQKNIVGGQINSVKLINMVNPYYSGMMQGFTVEVLKGNSTIVLEKAYFAGNIEIYPGILNVTYKGNDNFKLSNTTYAFFINLVNPVDSYGKLYINFTNDWYLFSPNCTIISGFKLKSIMTSSDPQIRCMLLKNKNSYIIENFERIDSSSRLVVTIFLQSPPQQNQYPVIISTFNPFKNAFIDLGVVNININATYGSTRVFAAHPMQIPIRLSSCQSGPLEITLFLKYPLPQTNVGTVGKILIEIFPQIPDPPTQNGIFTCYFFATVPASKCTYDTTSKPDRTIVTVYTPVDQTFHESEIPITITTVGPSPGFNAGIQLPKLVQRYLFYITFWDCECSVPQDVPKEVYFTEFVPYAFNIPQSSISATSLVTNQNEFTYLKFQYTHPNYNGVCTAPSGFDLYELQRNYIYRVDFLNYNQQSWQSYVGYGQKQIIQNYPCYVYGTQIDPTDKITCDLHCDQFQSYLTIQGFKTSKVTISSTINIEIPRIGIVDKPNVQVYYQFSLNEETPGMLDPYVQIYRYQGLLFTTTQYPTSVSYNIIPQITLSNSQVNQASSHDYSFGISSSAQFIIYELQQVPSIFPNLEFKVFTCGPSSSQCITYPFPVNWIVFTPSSTQSSNAQTQINSADIFKNPPYAGIFVYHARTISSSSVTQTNTLLFNVDPGIFNPATMSLDSSEDPNEIYKLLEHKFVISITTQNPVQKDGGLLLTVYNCQFSQSKYFYLEVNGINQLNIDGFLYQKVSSTQLKIYNLDSFNANIQIQIVLYLLMPNTSTANIQIDVATYWNRNFQNKVDNIQNLLISQPLNLKDIAMQDFEIAQPVEINQTPGVNYVGPFFTNFTPQNSNPQYIRCTWQVDFTTPGVPGQDPLICQVAEQVVPCYYQTSAPLTIILDTKSITISNLQTYQISVSTQYVAPENGLKFPSQGGWYEYDIEVLDNSLNSIEKYSQFIFITPKLMNYLKTESAISQQNTQNIISFYFSNTDPIPQYSNGGLIQIQFPTQSVDGTVNLFDSSLGISGGVTGTPVGCWFSASIPGNNLSCSLIKSQTTGRPAYIEIHNFDQIPANTDMIIRVGGIYNPINQVSLVTLTVTILQRNIATGTYYYINQMQDNLALNIPASANPQPIELQQILVTFPGSTPQFSHPLKSDVTMNIDDYFISILPSPFLQISTNKGVLPSCDLNTYQYCISFSNINWIVLKLKVQLAANTIQNTIEDILELPQYVPNSSITFNTLIWINSQYNKYLKNIITSTIFDGIVTPITISAVKCAGNPNKCLQKKKRVEVLISFTNPKQIPLNGAILIMFPPEFPNIYAHCRSSTANGSSLYSLAGNYAGEIGCEVQSTRNWVINGFQQTPSGSNIAIYGYVDMPAVGGQTLDVQIYVYYNYDQSDQFANGFKIMRTTTAGKFTVISQDPLGLSENTSVFKIDSPIKSGYIGPFVAQLNFNTNCGIFNLYFSLKDYVNNADSVGFGITVSTVKYRCAFYKQQPETNTLSNYMNCNIKSISITTNFVVVQIEPLNPNALVSGITYTFELTSQKGDGTVEGIEWPTKSGVYQIVIENTSINLNQSLYADIIENKFTNADVQGYITLQSETNLIDVSLTPSIQILPNNLLVIEIGTISSDSTTQLYSANPGGLQNYQQIIIDVIPTTTTNTLDFECRFSQGNIDTNLNGGISLKVLCSKFSRTIPVGEVLRFVFEMKNPSLSTIPQQITVPLNIYTLDVQANRKLNYILIENSSLFVTAFDPASNIISSSASFTPSSSSLSVTNSDLTFQSANSQPLGPKDTYILRFQFLFVGKASINLNSLNQSGSIIGQVILLKNLQTLLLNPSTGFTLNNANVATVIGCWNTPQYLLATSVTGYAYYRSQRKTEKITYTTSYGDGSGTPTPSSGITLSMSLVNAVNLAGQKEDYIIKITAPQFKSTKKLMIKFPNNIFGVNSFDCMMSQSSQIEINRCYIKKIGTEITIWIDITNNPQHLNTAQQLIIQTRNLAMVNPQNTNIAVNMNTFFVKFFSWSGNTEPTGIDNSITLNDYVIQSGTDSSGTTFSFASNTLPDHPVLDIQHFRYIDDFYLSDGLLTRALIQFEFKVPTALQATPTNTLKIIYPQQITIDTLITQTSDTLRNTLRCTINNNYRQCSIDQSTRTISIQFSYAITVNQIIFVQVGVIDPFNYPQKFGFGWNTDYTYGQFLVQISDGTNNIFLNSDVQNMKAIGTGIVPQNGFSTMQIRYVQTSVINSDCLIEIVFTWNVDDILTLLIEIPTTNEDQTPIYDTDIFPGMLSGQNIPCVINPTDPASGSINNLKESTNQILDCIIEKGEVGNFGRPMRIYVRGFSYTKGLSNNLLFKIVTPSVVGRVVNFKIKAIGGDNSINQVGDKLIAWSDMYKVLVTVSGVSPTVINDQIEFVDSSSSSYGFPYGSDASTIRSSSSLTFLNEPMQIQIPFYVSGEYCIVPLTRDPTDISAVYDNQSNQVTYYSIKPQKTLYYVNYLYNVQIFNSQQITHTQYNTAKTQRTIRNLAFNRAKYMNLITPTLISSTKSNIFDTFKNAQNNQGIYSFNAVPIMNSNIYTSLLSNGNGIFQIILDGLIIQTSQFITQCFIMKGLRNKQNPHLMPTCQVDTANIININQFDFIDGPLQIVYQYAQNIGTYNSIQANQYISLYINQASLNQNLPSYYQSDLRYQPSLITTSQLIQQNFVLAQDLSSIQVQVQAVPCCKFYSVGNTIIVQFLINTDDEQLIGANVNVASTFSITFGGVSPNSSCMITTQGNEQARVLSCQFTATSAMDIDTNWVNIQILFTGGTPLVQRDFYWFRINICDTSQNVKHTLSIEYARNDPISSQPISVTSISQAAGSPTLLIFTIKSINIALNPTNNQKLFIEFQSNDWPNQLIQDVDVSVSHALISCLCYEDIVTQPILTTQCYFHRKSQMSKDFLPFHLIEIPLTVQQGKDVKCLIPMVLLPQTSSTNLNIAFVSTIESIRPFFSSRNLLQSQARYYQNSLAPLVSQTGYTIAQTYTVNFPLNIYDGSVFIGSTVNNYEIQINGANPINTPSIIISIDPASGPIFNKQMCLNNQDCQVIGTSILYYRIQQSNVQNFSTQKAAISLINYAQKIFTDYKIQIFIYSQDGRWSYDPNTFTIPQSQNGLKPPAAQAITASLMPYSMNTCGQFATYVFTTSVELEDMSLNYAFQLVLKKTEIPSVTQACSAKSLSNKALLLCRYTYDAVNQYYTVTILRGDTNVVKQSMTIMITLELQNPTPTTPTLPQATAQYEIRYYRKFVSQTNYQMISSNSNTLTFDNSQQAAGFVQYSRTYLKFYRFSPIVPCDGVSITTCPIRFFYQNNLPATNYNTLQIQVATNTIASSTSVPVTCLAKINNPNGSYTRNPLNCNFINPLNQGIVQITNPTATTIISSGQTYEIIITLGYLNLPVVDFSNTSYLATITTRISSSNVLRTQRRITQYQGTSHTDFQKFFILSTLESQTSSIYFEAQLANAQVAANLFPSSYIEILLPQVDYSSPLTQFKIGLNKIYSYLFFQFFYLQKIGQQIPCDISSDLVSIPNYQTPICTINLKSSTGPVFIRLEKFNSYIAGAKLTLAIDDIKLVNLIDLQTFDMTINIQNGSTFYTKTAINLIQLQIQPPYNPPIIDSNTYQFTSDSLSLGATVTYSGSITWPVNSQSGQFGDKYRISLGTQGIIGVGNSLAALAFDDNLIWRNKQTQRVIIKSPTRSLGNTFNLKIKNVVNPVIANLIYYGSNPTFITEFYQTFSLKNQVNSLYPSFSNFINPTQPIQFISFTSIPSQYTSNRNELFSLTFQIPNVLPFQEVLIQLKDSTILKFKNCLLVRSNGNELSQCSVISSSIIGLFGISLTSISPATHQMFLIAEILKTTNPIAIDLLVTNDGINIYNLFLNIQINSPAGYSSITSSMQAFNLNKIKYYSTQNTLTITQPTIYAGTNVNQIFFEFVAIKQLTYNQNPSQNEQIYITLADNSGNFQPMALIDANNLVCYFLLKNSNSLQIPNYSNLYLASSCILDKTSASPIYKIGSPTVGLVQGNTYQVIIYIDGNQNSQFKIPSTFSRDELLFQMTGLPATVSDTIILQTTIQNFNQININYGSMQQQEKDNLLILNLNLINTLQVTDSTHDVFIRLELDSQFFPSDAGLQNYYQTHYLPQFNTGNIHSISSNPYLSSMKLVASFGNPSNKQEPIKYSIMPFSQLSSSTPYTILIPALTNPNLDCQLTLRVTLMMQDNTGDSVKVISRQTLFNNQRTQQSSASTFTITQSSTNNQIQSTNMQWSTYITQYGGSLTQSQYLLLAYNNNNLGIVKTSFQKFTVSGFNIHFFSNINVYLINPLTTQTGTIQLTFSPFSTSDDSASFGWQYGKIFNGLITQYYNSGTSTTLSIITSLVGQIYRNRGFRNVNSQYEIVLNLNAPKIPKGGYLYIKLDSTFLQVAPSPVGDQCFPGKNVANDPSSPLVCYKISDYEYIVQGTIAFTQSTAIQINMFLVGKNPNPTVTLPTVKAYGPNGLVAEIFNLASIPIDGSPNSVKQAVVIMKYLKNIYCNQYGPFQFNFKLRQNNIIQVQNDYIQLTAEASWQIAPPPAIQSAFYKQTSQLAQYNSIFNNVSVNPLIINLPPALNEQFTKQISYTFSIDTTQAAVPGQNGIQRPQCGFYQFSLAAFKGGSALSNIVEKDTTYFLLEPQPDTSFVFKPLIQSVNRKTAYRMTFTTNVNIMAGDQIWFSFITSNFINDIFPETLGFTLNQDGFGQIDCAENPGQNLISSTQIKCYVHKGDKSVVPPQMASVQIAVDKPIAVGTTIIIWLSNIQNPSKVGVVSSVQAAVKRQCRDDISMCNIYVSYNYFQTIADNQNIINSNQVSTATSTSSQQVVYKTNCQHTFNLMFLQTVKTSDFIVIYYRGENYKTGRMSPTCVFNNFCIVFPLDQIVVVQSNSQITANQFSLTLAGMTNGFFLLDNTINFQLEVWDGVQSVINCIYQIPAILYSYETQSMTMTITPTQTYNVKMPPPTTTQNYFLRDYMNTVEIQVKGVWLNQDITNFYFTIPTQVAYIQNNYCNATLTITDTNRKPYPLRFDCNLITSSMIELDMTNEMIPFQSTYQTFTIQIYLKFYIDISAPAGTTDNFQLIGGIDRYPQNYNQYRAISLAQQKIDILPYVLPNLSYLTFNTKSFYDREARICETQVEFYMILFPNTSDTDFKVDQLVFRLPNEFGYPAVKGFDNCSIKGKFNDNVLQCILQRKFAETKVFLQPDTTYNQQPKIIEINDKQGNLFTAPCIPGAQYNITVELYSQGTLVEKQTIITSPILGVPLAPSQMSMVPYLDASESGLFEFKFQLGQYWIPQGYDAPQAKQFSTIVLTFDSKIGKGYLNDLGTGLKTGDELGCVIKQQIPSQPAGFQLAQNQDRLKCVLQQGWDSVNLPRINITGYQEMPAGTVVQFLITNIQALPTTVTSTVSMGVAVTYKNTNVTAFFYQSTAIIPTITTQDGRTIDTTGQIQQLSNYPSSQNVLGYSDYLFTFTSGQIISINDYLAFQFDEDMFNRYSDYSQVGCVQGANTPCSEIYVFGITNQIYIKPGAVIAASSAQTITIKKLINAAYSYSGILNVQGFSQVSQKVDKVYPVSTNIKIIPCNQFQEVIISINKIVGGENNATITLSIIPGHPIPPYGAISVLFSQLYPFDLMQMKSSCQVTSKTSQNYYGLSRINCVVSAYNRVDIYLNNSTYSQKDQIILQIYGLNTPNFVIPQQIPITISSLFDSNIYAGRKICQIDTYFPQMTYISPQTCNMFVIQGSSNVNTLSLYTFKFICQQQYIKDGSTIFIYIDPRFRLSNPIGNILNCYSTDMVTLASSQCQLLLNSNFKYGLQASLRSIEAQTFFEFSLYLQNPDYPGNNYYFSAEISKFSSLYAVADDQINILQYVSLIRPSINIDVNSQIQILNVPRNAGEKSTYAIGIPPNRIYSTTTPIDTVILEFPSNFASYLGDSLICGVYFSQNKPTQENFSYKILLSVISQKVIDGNYYQVPCNIISTHKISFKISQISQFNDFSQNNWVNWMIKNIVNPSQYEKLEGFKFTYFSKGAISWQFQGKIQYQISYLPKTILSTGIQVSDNNINTQASYQFGLQSFSSIPFQNQMAISIRLPAEVFSSVVNIQTKPFCSIFDSTNKTSLVSSFCDFYDYELLIENVLLNQFNLTQILVNVTNILNPTTEFSCNLKDYYLSANVSFFEIKLIDLSIGDVLFTNNINTDQNNCVDYVDNLFNTVVIGPSILSPGLSYNFKINIEEPAEGLVIVPSSDLNGIKFDPRKIEFSNFEGTSYSFNVIVSSDLMASKPFYIRFQQTEQNGKFYLPLVPQKVQIVAGQQIQQATVTVQDVDVETTGYPIIVPVIVSQPPANLLNLVVQVSSECQNIIEINSSQILIDSNTYQTNFTMTVNVNQVPSFNCIIYFSLSSYGTIIHTLKPILKQVSFSLSNSYTNPKTLRVILDKNQRPPSQDAGKPCLNMNTNSNAQLAIPAILTLQLISTDANHAQFQAFTKSFGYFVAIFALQGSPSPTFNQIKNPYTYPYSVSTPQTILVHQIITDKVDYIVKFDVKGLESQTNFVVYGMVFNPNGYSLIKNVYFKTQILNYGAIIRIPLSNLLTPQQVIEKLSKTIRVPQSRFINITSYEYNLGQQNKYSKNSDIVPNYFYEVILTPDKFNDNPSPDYLAEKFINNQASQFQKMLPYLNLQVKMTTQLQIQIPPDIQIEPKITYLSYYQVQISLKLVSQGYVYAQIQPKSNSTSLLSRQIYYCLDQQNFNQLSELCFSGLTDPNGNIVISFNNILDSTLYSIYITVSTNMIYVPNIFYENNEVRQLQVNTPINQNLFQDEGDLTSLKSVNPSLGEAIEKFLLVPFFHHISQEDTEKVMAK